MFLTEDMYNDHITAIFSDEGFISSEESEKYENSYLYYQKQTGDFIENDYIVLVKDSSTYIVIASIKDAEAAEDVFNHLTLSIEK